MAGLVYGRRKSDESTIQAVAKALRLPEPTIRKWADLAPGEVGAWVPPAEANQLDRRTRAALDELVRAIAASGSRAAGGDAGTVLDLARPPAPDLSRVAARRGESQGRHSREAQDVDAETQDRSHE